MMKQVIHSKVILSFLPCDTSDSDKHNPRIWRDQQSDFGKWSKVQHTFICFCGCVSSLHLLIMSLACKMDCRSVGCDWLDYYVASSAVCAWDDAAFSKLFTSRMSWVDYRSVLLLSLYSLYCTKNIFIFSPCFFVRKVSSAQIIINYIRNIKIPSIESVF